MIVAQPGRELVERDPLGLRIEPNQAASRGELERTLVAVRPEHAALRLRLEAQALDDALGERLERDAGEESERALEQPALTHELDVLRQQPRVLALEPPLLEDRLEAQPERAAVERLEQVVARAELHGVDGGAHVDDSRYDHDVLLGIAGLHAMHELAAVHSGHHEIGEHDVEGRALEQVQRFFAARRGLGLEALGREELLDQLAEIALVVDRQHAGFGHDPPSRSPRASGSGDRDPAAFIGLRGRSRERRQAPGHARGALADQRVGGRFHDAQRQ